jgi:hypothetical protein
LPAKHVVRPSITPKRWQFHDRSIRRDDVVTPDRPTKITFGDMRKMGVRGVLVYCADYHCQP